MLKHFSLPIALTLSLLMRVPASAQAGETKTVILLEIGGAVPIECDPLGTYSKSAQQCIALSESDAEKLRGQVFVEMRLDPNCAGMAFFSDYSDLKNYLPFDEIDYITVSVSYFPATNAKTWFMNILTMNGNDGPGSMGGAASSAKEIAHKLCYIIHQEKITRR